MASSLCRAAHEKAAGGVGTPLRPESQQMVNVTDFTGGGKMPPQAEQPPVQPGVGAGGEHTPDNHNPGPSPEQGGSQTPKRPFFLDEEPPPGIKANAKPPESKKLPPWEKPPTKPEDIILEVAVSTDTITELRYLVEPYLPENQVVGFYGKGETAKSSFVATMAAHIAPHSSTLWISVEEDPAWIKVRHVKAGGGDGTLYVFRAIETKLDAYGKPVASNFNVYDHLEPAIIAAKVQTAETAHFFTDQCERPLRLVVLDTAVALTTWGRGEKSTDDASVKRLMAHLDLLCRTHGVTIALIGHFNKGKHDNIADMVSGAGSWTTSVRQAFGHFADRREEYGFVIATVKSSLTGKFAATYTTRPVHTLAHRADGSDSVLCAVHPGAITWGQDNMLDLIASATATDDDDYNSGTGFSQKHQRYGAIIETVTQLVNDGNPNVTRRLVSDMLNATIDGRRWQKVEASLAADHNIYPVVKQHGLIVYERRP